MTARDAAGMDCGGTGGGGTGGGGTGGWMTDVGVKENAPPAARPYIS